MDVLQTLPGMSKGIEDFTDEEELGLLGGFNPLTSLRKETMALGQTTMDDW